jgi:serine/threonine protein kinase
VRFGSYVVHECVGSGGMATVHRASIDLGGGVTRDVALKRLLPHLADDERFVEDFIREAKLAAHLRHPNIIQIYDLGRIGNTYFIAMELVRGISLMSLMRLLGKQHRTLSISAVLSLMLELTEALDHAHHGTTDAGQPLELVHRDLTPSNLLITDDGHLKIIDFGIAKANRGELSTDSGLAKGKRGYMALEAIRAEDVDARADLFSAGVVMWELLTGHPLFKPSDAWDETLVERGREIQRPSAFNRDCPPALDQIVLRAIENERDRRWSSAEEMRRAIAPIARIANAAPAEVVRCKQAVRPVTSERPYAGFEVEADLHDEGIEVVISQTPRPLDWTGSLWPAEPATEPKLMQRVEGTSSWPVEPVTEPKLYTAELLERARSEDSFGPEVPSVTFGPEVPSVSFGPEGPSVQVKELPVQFRPARFESEAPREGATMAVRPKRPPPAPFRQQRATARPPAPGAAVDRLDRPALVLGQPAATEDSWPVEPDTQVEHDPFDEE